MANQENQKAATELQKWFNQAIYSHKTGRLREAEAIYKKMITAGISDPQCFAILESLQKQWPH